MKVVGFCLVVISAAQLVYSLCDQFLIDTGEANMLKAKSVASALLLMSMVRVIRSENFDAETFDFVSSGCFTPLTSGL